jgi:hypothetical protein
MPLRSRGADQPPAILPSLVTVRAAELVTAGRNEKTQDAGSADPSFCQCFTCYFYQDTCEVTQVINLHH